MRGFVSGWQIGTQGNCRHRLEMESGRGEAVSTFEGLGADRFPVLSPLPYKLTPLNLPYLPEEREPISGLPRLCTVAESVPLWYNTGVKQIRSTGGDNYAVPSGRKIHPNAECRRIPPVGSVSADPPQQAGGRRRLHGGSGRPSLQIMQMKIGILGR